MGSLYRNEAGRFWIQFRPQPGVRDKIYWGRSTKGTPSRSCGTSR